MKKLLSILSVVVLLSCGANEKTSEHNQSNTATHAILEKNIKENLEYLTSDELEGRSTGSKGIEKAAVFLEEYFKKTRLNRILKPTEIVLISRNKILWAIIL